MSVKPEIETTSSPFDVVLLILSLGLLIGGIAGFYYFDDYPAWQRWVGVAVATLAGVLLAVQTHMGRSAWDFILGSRNEVRKMVWPTRQETVQTTFGILIVVVLLGIVLWLLDMGLVWGTKYLTGQGG